MTQLVLPEPPKCLYSVWGSGRCTSSQQNSHCYRRHTWMEDWRMLCRGHWCIKKVTACLDTGSTSKHLALDQHLILSSGINRSIFILSQHWKLPQSGIHKWEYNLVVSYQQHDDWYENKNNFNLIFEVNNLCEISLAAWYHFNAHTQNWLVASCLNKCIHVYTLL